VSREALPACSDLSDGWTKRDVVADRERIFATGFGESTKAAETSAISAMTHWLGARISSRSVDWVATGGGRDDARYEATAESYASHSLSACKVERACGNGEQIAALVSCLQGTSFERELATLGEEIGAKLPPGTTLLLPGVNEDQFVTRLGKLALTTMRPAVRGARVQGLHPRGGDDARADLANDDPSNRNNNLGFRCAQSSPPVCASFTDAAPAL
jgi:hypothetical protein